MIDVLNLAYSCLIDGGTEADHMTVEDAAITLENWKAEGWKEIEGITPEEFAAAWNEVADYFNR